MAQPQHAANDDISLSQVVELNNLGVVYFEARQFPQALTLFRDALQLIITPGTPASQASPLPPSQQRQQVNPCTPILKAAAHQHRISDMGGDDASQHMQAIEIVPTPKAYSEDPLASQTIVASMVIWNLALVYHITSNHNQARLQKAYSLYKKSWILVQPLILEHYHQQNATTTNHPVVDLFVQALLNNLADCCQQLHNYEHAELWSERLLSYAGSISAANAAAATSDPTILAILQEQTDQFVLNAIMRLQCRPSHLAAAA
jgi:tetratricopeptide (TPR) repeat protein